jgi:hypothetical protein
MAATLARAAGIRTSCGAIAPAPSEKEAECTTSV